jgi:hypothetical protein
LRTALNIPGDETIGRQGGRPATREVTRLRGGQRAPDIGFQIPVKRVSTQFGAVTADGQRGEMRHDPLPNDLLHFLA